MTCRRRSAPRRSSCSTRGWPTAPTSRRKPSRPTGNVKGLNFIALHELFDGINEDVEDYVDDIAERAVQLGGVAEGTARMVAKRSSLREYPANAVDGHSHADALSAALAAFGAAARKAIDQANGLGDLDTTDVFTEISRGIDKWLWMVEAHLHR
jgi:starvation-inducible DNA-binding protein